jgi:MFS family permease
MSHQFIEQPVRSQTERSPSLRWVLASLSLSMVLSSLGTSIANVALPAIAESFGASFQAVQWVVLAYLLSVTALVVGVGRLGDIIGRRRLLLIGIALFTAASAFCALAPTLPALIAARAVQGLGAATMMSLTMAMVGEAIPKARTGTAMGLLGTMSATGTALGPSVGGILLAGTGWQGIFFINLPLGALTFLVAYRGLPVGGRPASANRATFDVWGTLLLASSLAAYALAMTLGRGQYGAVNVAWISAAVCGLGLFALVETRVASPLIRLSVIRDPVLGAGFAMTALVSTVMMATLVVGPFYLSEALGLHATSVGITMSIGPVVAALAGVPAGRLVDRFGASSMVLFGLILIEVGATALSVLPSWLGISGYVAPIAMITAGYALFQAANNTAVMAELRPDQRGVVSGILNLSRNLGLVTGASALGAVFALAVAGDHISTASPENVAAGLRVTFAVAAALMLGALAIAAISRAAFTRGLPSEQA